MNNTSAIQACGLTKRFGVLRAVNDLDWEIPTGSLCALLGPNGSGKTTLMQLLLGLLKPDSGHAQVLGDSSAKLAADAFQKIGYVAEGQEYPGWMTGESLFRWCRSVYANWDDDFCSQIVRDFEIPLRTRLDRCSRGQRMKILLLSSIAFRPKLLALDEPFSGLDPVHREEFGEALLGIADAGEWTLIISSHDVDDIERLVDRVAILRGGRIVLAEETEILRQRFRRIEGRLSDAKVGREVAPPKEWREFRHEGRRLSFVDTEFDRESCRKRLLETFGEDVTFESSGMSLREIYVALARKWKGPRS